MDIRAYFGYRHLKKNANIKIINDNFRRVRFNL